MSYLISFLFFLATSLGVSAESYPYQLKGTYKFESVQKKPIEFTLKWSEEKGKITGIYSDNFFIDSAEVAGSNGDLGRNFIVKLPQARNGVRTITLLTSQTQSQDSGKTLPVSIVTRDGKGNPVTSTNATPVFSTVSIVAQRQEESCQEEFGVLAGYCGLYIGLISEDQDRRNKCNLLYTDAVRLELTPDATFVLHFGQVNSLVEPPRHVIGRLPVDPQKSRIDVMSRSCRPLLGVNSAGDTCKQLNLRGLFTTEENDRKHFSGTYTIKEENTNTECIYSLSLDMGT